MWEHFESPDTTPTSSSHMKSPSIAHELKETLTDGVRFVIKKTQEMLRWALEWVESILSKVFK
jgi:hypothetical protein